jgi:hypothetical protein
MIIFFLFDILIKNGILYPSDRNFVMNNLKVIISITAFRGKHCNFFISCMIFIISKKTITNSLFYQYRVLREMIGGGYFLTPKKIFKTS